MPSKLISEIPVHVMILQALALAGAIFGGPVSGWIADYWGEKVFFDVQLCSILVCHQLCTLILQLPGFSRLCFTQEGFCQELVWDGLQLLLL